MSPPDRKTLEYNIIWMERTFKERKTTEQLLAPERDAGVLTQHDYDAALAFLPGMHRHYNTIGTVAGASAAYALKRPSWPTGRTVGLVAFGALAGRAFGSAIAVMSHYKFIEKIEEPERFSAAMENVQRRLGKAAPKAPGIVMKPRRGGVEEGEGVDGGGGGGGGGFGGPVVEEGGGDSFPPPEPRPIPPFPSPSPSSSEAPPQPAAPTPTSSWDRIRTANGHGTARPSSWDALRQTQAKAELQRRPPPPSSQSPQSDFPPDTRFREEDDQAKFDAMLERERNMKP
ncbi:hypothetical protein DFP72DRAFT_1165938 [Ephemerocybe angulata]|uniref:Uncharacterized protein n=1 Tax=Ephemerocybe angulata TaxID=980116 RepID=A0A8H6I939_9AGAR|nr:hypothetical protein DFP72DRAFT_1165938 [Tulosesus angulatus]